MHTTYNNVRTCMHAGPHHCVRTWWEGPTGAGGCRMVCLRHDKHHVHAGWEGSEGDPYIMQSDLGGGVNGHDVNLREECGVCDDVTG